MNAELETGHYLVEDRYDLSMFDGAPGLGPYATLDEAENARRLIEDLVSGATPD
jgi:hypothetical protein